MSRMSVSGAMVLLLVAAAAEEGRWVWGGSGRNAGFPSEVLESRPVPSYRPPAPVVEGTDYVQPTYVPQRPQRPPLPPPPPPPPIYRPGPGPVSRPPPPPPPPPGRPGSAPGILTGPVPSWEQGREDPTAYKHYDRCKCAHSFNCPAPGIKFGSCGADKIYCCFNTKGEHGYQHQGPGSYGPGSYGPGDFGPGGGGRPGLVPGGRPGRYDDRDRPVLVGPHGPTGILIDPDRPYGRPFIANGGPAGDYARPRPTFAERPGPYDDLYDDLVRSNKNAGKD